MDDTDPEQLVRLVAAAAAGDQKAWRDIVERCTPRVHAVVRAQCRDDDLAEEIVQSAFCTVVQKLSEYQEGGRFEAWLLRIAMNRLRDEMRRRGRQAVSTDTSTMVEIAGVPETVIDSIAREHDALRCRFPLSVVAADREAGEVACASTTERALADDLRRAAIASAALSNLSWEALRGAQAMEPDMTEEDYFAAAYEEELAMEEEARRHARARELRTEFLRQIAENKRKPGGSEYVPATHARRDDPLDPAPPAEEPQVREIRSPREAWHQNAGNIRKENLARVLSVSRSAGAGLCRIQIFNSTSM